MVRSRTLTLLVLAAPLLTTCGAYEKIKGGRTSHPTTNITSAPNETGWVLISNPMFEATPDEPEYIWVEEAKIPRSPNILIFGKQSVLAPPEVVAKYGAPPGGGKISPLQIAPARLPRSEAAVAPATPPRPLESRRPLVREVTPRGYIIYIDKRRIMVDLTSVDGLKQGSILSLRRRRIPLTHPVTGESLGDSDEEIGTAQVVEVRERFSIAVIHEIRRGFEPRVKDRVVVKRE